MSPIVFKVGGSLFDLPELAGQLNHQLQQYPDQPRLLIAGGGAAADVVRDWDRNQQLSPEVSHTLAVHSMSLSARFLQTILPQTQLVTSMAQAKVVWGACPRSILVLDVVRDVLGPEAAALLPASWDVTSDAIATWIAIQLAANQLVLLKSVDRPPRASWQDLALQGHLDSFTPELLATAPQLVVDWVNMRQGILSMNR